MTEKAGSIVVTRTRRLRAIRILQVAASSSAFVRAEMEIRLSAWSTTASTFGAEAALYGHSQPSTASGIIARNALNEAPRRFQGHEAYAWAEARLQRGRVPFGTESAGRARRRARRVASSKFVRVRP